MNPFTRIGLETAAVIIVMIILLVLAAYLLGSFTM
jgi:type II secretory pathway pseudopilin PulG